MPRDFKTSSIADLSARIVMPDVSPSTEKQSLSYDSAYSQQRRSNLERASILMGLLGVVTIAGAAGITGLFLLVFAAFGGETSAGGPYGLASMSLGNWLFVAVVGLVPAAIGTIDLLCAYFIGKGSLAALVLAIALVSVQMVAAAMLGVLRYVNRFVVPCSLETVAFLIVGIVGALTLFNLIRALANRARG